MGILTAVALVLASPRVIAVMPPEGAQVASEVRESVQAELSRLMAEKHWSTVDFATTRDAQALASLRACGENPTCYERAARELGADGVLLVAVAQRAPGIQVDLTLLGIRDGRVIGRARGDSREGAAGAVEEATAALAVQFDAMPLPAEAPTPQQPRSRRTRGAGFWAPVIAGGVIMLAGAFTVGYAQIDLNATNGRIASTVFADDTQADVGRARTDVAMRTAGIVGLCLGAVGIGAGIFFYERSAYLRPEVIPSPIDPTPY